MFTASADGPFELVNCRWRCRCRGHVEELKLRNYSIIALDCVLVTWNTNRNISDKDPERYLAERLDGTSVGEAEVRARLAAHLGDVRHGLF